MWIGRCGIHSGSTYSIKHICITAQWNIIVPFASSFLLFFRVIIAFYSMTCAKDVLILIKAKTSILTSLWASSEMHTECLLAFLMWHEYCTLVLLWPKHRWKDKVWGWLTVAYGGLTHTVPFRVFFCEMEI